MAIGSKPAVWIIDPATSTASLTPVTIAGYEAGTVVIEGGLNSEERVVVDGGKLLSSGQPVRYEEERS
jgi:multidrug efflux pump subunit AcrA (membrane-fusion protein)